MTRTCSDNSVSGYFLYWEPTKDQTVFIDTMLHGHNSSASQGFSTSTPSTHNFVHAPKNKMAGQNLHAEIFALGRARRVSGVSASSFLPIGNAARLHPLFDRLPFNKSYRPIVRTKSN